MILVCLKPGKRARRDDVPWDIGVQNQFSHKSEWSRKSYNNLASLPTLKTKWWFRGQIPLNGITPDWRIDGAIRSVWFLDGLNG